MGHGGPQRSLRDRAAALAIIAVIAIVVVALSAWYRGGGRPRGWQDKQPMMEKGRGAGGGFASRAPRWQPDLAFGYPYNYAIAGLSSAAGPAEAAHNCAINRMYSTAEVDPFVTGQLYAGPRAAGPGQRFIYGGRTSHRDKWGLHEFSSGVPGQAGVDVGLLGMREYSLDGRPDVFDDGIPENWKLPSTPTNWYVPQGRDYYDVEANGPGVYKAGLMSLQEPDHEPLSN